MNDRQRVELSLPVQMMLTVLISGMNTAEGADAIGAREHLLEAAAEPLSDLLPEHQFKILRRVKRLHRDILAPYSSDNAKAAQVGLVTFYLLQELVDEGVLIVGEDSNFAKALAYILPAIEHEMTSEIEAIARRQASECLTRLKASGYYNYPLAADLAAR